MKELIRLLVVGVVVVLVVAVPARSQFKSKASHVNNRIVSTNFDTLSTADQSYVDSLAWKAASMVLEVKNEYGSNAGSQSRKNWGILHIHDGDDGTDHGCGQSIYTIGDGSFGTHYKSGGEHSSAIKATAIGNFPNHRLFNILMSIENEDYNNHYGILIRNPSDEGIPLNILNGSNEPAIFITDTNVSDDKDAKAMIEVLADSAAEATSDFINLGLKLGGTSFEGTADRYITMVDYNSVNYWGFKIDPGDDELIFCYNNDEVFGISTSGDIDGVGGIFSDLTSTGTLEQSIGSNIASAATITLGAGNSFIVTGTADIDSIDTDSPQDNGTVVYLMFSGSAGSNGVVDGKNIKIAGDFAYAGGTNDGDVLTLIRINNAFYEVSRSVN